MQQPRQEKSNSIYVGNIAWKTTEQEIGDTFANFGFVKSVKIITDKETGRSKGFGFVEFDDSIVIPGVIRQMNGYNLNGRQLKVNCAAGSMNRPMGQMQGAGPGMGMGNQGGNPMNMPQQGMPQQGGQTSWTNNQNVRSMAGANPMANQQMMGQPMQQQQFNPQMQGAYMGNM